MYLACSCTAGECVLVCACLLSVLPCDRIASTVICLLFWEWLQNSSGSEEKNWMLWTNGQIDEQMYEKKRLHYKFFSIKYTDEPQQQQQPNHLFKIVWAILMLPKQPWPLMGLTGLNLFQCIAWSNTVVWMLVLGLFQSSFYGVTEHSNLATDVRGCHGWVLLVYNISDIYKATFTSAASRTLHYNVITLFTSRVCGVNIEVDTVWVCFSCFTEGT